MSSIHFIAAGDLSESFKKLVNDCFQRVDGVLVEKTLYGYRVFGKEVYTMEQVQEIISEARGSLNKSIKRA